MPDPLIVVQAMAAAAFAAAAILLGSAGWKRPGDAGRVAIGWPLVVGWFLRSHTADGGIVVCLACLGSILVMGRFFGALSTMHALLLAGAPLLCWLGESRWLRTQIASGGARGHDL